MEGEPWVEYRTRVDLLFRLKKDTQIIRRDMQMEDGLQWTMVDGYAVNVTFHLLIKPLYERLNILRLQLLQLLFHHSEDHVLHHIDACVYGLMLFGLLFSFERN